jgi:hypothetical protein
LATISKYGPPIFWVFLMLYSTICHSPLF